MKMKTGQLTQELKPLLAEPVHDEELFDTLYKIFMMSNENGSYRQSYNVGFCGQEVDIDTPVDSVTIESIQSSVCDRNEVSMFPEYTANIIDRRSSLCWHEYPLPSDTQYKENFQLPWNEHGTMSIGLDTCSDEGMISPIDVFVADETPLPGMFSVMGSRVGNPTDQYIPALSILQECNSGVCEMSKCDINPSLLNSFRPYSNSDQSIAPMWPTESLEFIQKPREEPNAIVARTPIPPLRALSAYNYFFRDEREHILRENDGVSDGENVQLSYTCDRQDKILQEHWMQDRNAKRRHRKSHGKISFTDLSRLVSQRWKLLPECHKDFYRETAARDLERYKKELKIFRETCGGVIAALD